MLVLALIGTTTWWFTSGRYRTVPDVAGLSQPDAETTLTENDLKPQIETKRRQHDPEAGTVIGTDPGKGAGDPAWRPDHAGRLARQAEGAGGAARAPTRPTRRSGSGRRAWSRTATTGRTGTPTTSRRARSSTVSPSAGTELQIGKRVVIVLSKGPEPKPVPDVQEQDADEAFKELRDQGFEPVRPARRVLAGRRGRPGDPHRPRGRQEARATTRRSGDPLHRRHRARPDGSRTAEEATSMLAQTRTPVEVQVSARRQPSGQAAVPGRTRRVEPELESRRPA